VRYLEVAPPPSLRPFVRTLWHLEGEAPGPLAPPERVVPDGCPELVLHFGAPYRLGAADGPLDSQGRAVFVGQLEGPADLKPTGPTGIVGVRFRPAGARDLAGLPMGSLAGRSVPLGDLWGREGEDLLDRVRSAPDASARLRLVAAALLRRSERAPRRWGPTEAAVRLLEATRGGMDVAAVAAAVGVGVRSLERRFADRVGIPPKRLARVLRLQAVLQRLPEDGAPPDWALLAQDGGYADQPHLVREFRAWTGRTPGDYLRALHPVHDFAR
jgi:AraC-like DNA-binding protein